jgi:hypothetical protein
MAGMSPRKAAKARRLVTGLAKEMKKKGDTSSSTAALARRADSKPLSDREKAKVAKRVVANQAKKASNIGSNAAPSAKAAVVAKTVSAGRAGGLGGKKTTAIFQKKKVAAESNKLKKGTKAVKNAYKINP